MKIPPKEQSLRGFIKVCPRQRSKVAVVCCGLVEHKVHITESHVVASLSGHDTPG